MTKIFFVSRSCRFVLIGGYIFKTGTTKTHETTPSTARVLSGPTADDTDDADRLFIAVAFRQRFAGPLPDPAPKTA